MNNKVKKIFKEIESIRSKNNKNWMDLLKLSYESQPKKTLKIISQILNKDQRLISLAKKLKKVSQKLEMYNNMFEKTLADYFSKKNSKKSQLF